MKLSPLQLLHSQFLGISIVARKVDLTALFASSDSYPIVEPDNIVHRIELGQPNEGASNEYALKVSLHTAKELPDTFPYRFAVQIEGVFQIEHDGNIDERKRLIVVNGASMLIGIIREQLLVLTLRHKNGAFLLPSIDLRGLSPLKQEPQTAKDTPEAAEAKPRKRARNRKPPPAPKDA